MRIPFKAQLPAILCALTLPFCALLIRPCAEMGINDDWSYIKTAQVLAQTGHIVYNGWAAAMLGWQLYLGALFVKLFGFSFTTVRLSTLVVAMATAYLLQRTFVRAGIHQWNATLATMTFILSPLFLPLTFSFMTDISGVFCTVLCLYMCLRALQAGSLPSTIAWIGLAALLNAIGGTARQSAWLGVLVMVPCTLWLLRRRPRVLLIGGISCVLGIGIVVASMHWFDQQPYTIPEKLIPDGFNLRSLIGISAKALFSSEELLLLLIPVTLIFAGALRKVNRRMIIISSTGAPALGILALGLLRHSLPSHKLWPFLGSYLCIGDYLSIYGLVNDHSVMGLRPVVIPYGIRLLLTLAMFIGLVSVLSVFFGKPRTSSSSSNGDSISWRDLCVILAPFSIAYIVLIASKSTSGFYDRYLLPLMMFSLLVLVRYYQDWISPKLPVMTVVLIGIVGLFSVAGTHDVFAMYRGYLAAIEEIRSSGVPATAIDGGWEYDGWVQIEQANYLNDSRIRIPQGAYVASPATVLPTGCGGIFLELDPQIKPLYGLSYDPGLCAGQSKFPPVIYHTWLPPRSTSIYIVKFPALSGQ
jgi:Dolichyl-phosphate-mannose-protein mannosyltransferase